MRKYKSEAMRATYEQAEGLYEGGIISKDELLGTVSKGRREWGNVV